MLLITGAGFSQACGLPGTNDVIRRAVESFHKKAQSYEDSHPGTRAHLRAGTYKEEVSEEEQLGGLSNFVWNENLERACRPIADALDKLASRQVDFETLLEACHQAIPAGNREWGTPFFLPPDQLYQHGNPQENLDALQIALGESLRFDQAVQTAQSFEEVRRIAGEPTGVITLNYDCALEAHLRNGGHLLERFDYGFKPDDVLEVTGLDAMGGPDGRRPLQVKTTTAMIGARPLPFLKVHGGFNISRCNGCARYIIWEPKSEVYNQLLGMELFGSWMFHCKRPITSKDPKEKAAAKQPIVTSQLVPPIGTAKPSHPAWLPLAAVQERARQLAQRERSALIVGLSFRRQDQVLANILSELDGQSCMYVGGDFDQRPKNLRRMQFLRCHL